MAGIQKNKEALYRASNIDVLDKRIVQLVQGGTATKVLKQPVTNLKNCFDYIESQIAKQMQEGSENNFAAKIDILRKKQENFKDEMRILIRQATSSRIEEIASYYASNNAEAAEGEAYTIFQDVEDKYTSKLTDLLVYIQRSFNDIDGINTMMDASSNLFFDLKPKDYSKRNIGIAETEEEIKPIKEEEKKGLFDFLKSNSKREKEKKERLEREAELLNERNQNKLNELIRVRQEARQYAASDMFELQNILITIINAGIVEKFEEIISYVQTVDCENKQLREEGRRKLRELSAIRIKLVDFENKLL